jgi:threonine dehydrogenase-like Zn-dependent dehydrogenase
VRALVYDPVTRRASVRRDVCPPQVHPGEARVRVVRAGICRTDIEILRGYVPFTGTLGHEFVGVVEDAHGRDDLVGARVVGEINVPCGACVSCRAGRGHHCPSRTVMGIVGRDGCIADAVVLPVANLHVVPAPVSDEAAVFAEPVAAAFRIAEQVDLSAVERALVMGDGKLGLLVAMALAPRVGALTLSGRHAHKLAIAARAGIPTVLSGAREPGEFDLVVECTGRPEGLREALGRVRPLGTVVLKSTIAGETTAPLSMGVVNEVTVVGSRCGPFPPALEALASGRIDPRPLIEARYPLDDAEDALAHAARAGALKVLVGA